MNVSRRRRHRAAALAGVLLVAAAVTPAAGHGPDPVVGGTLWPQNQVLGFRWRSGAEPPTAIKTAIRDAAADVGATRASKAATYVYDAAGANPIGYGLGATCGINGLACFSRSAPAGFTLWFREQGHVFDWGTLKWCQMYGTAPNGCYDAETIALDELGHVEILDHHVNYTDDSDYDDAVVQTFSRTKPRAGWDRHGLGRCDVATLQRKYDMSSWASLYSTCLDVDTDLTLAPTSASIAYDSTTTLRATLRTVDRTAYERLGGNPIANRIVRLEARTVGSTSWVAVGTMAPDTPGTYALLVQLKSSTDFRAIFATPTNEGLNGDSSLAVRVTVAACTTRCPMHGGRVP